MVFKNGLESAGSAGCTRCFLFDRVLLPPGLPRLRAGGDNRLGEDNLFFELGGVDATFCLELAGEATKLAAWNGACSLGESGRSSKMT